MPWLDELTWQDAREALVDARVAVWPVGATEQHGPHLSVATDATIAEAFARRIVDDLGAHAIGLPALRVGLSEHHLGFPGTLTLRPETYLALVDDVVESIADWGLRRMLVVNGHGGNIDVLRLATRQARRDRGVELASLMWAQVAADVVADVATSPSYGHACETETAVAMAIAPHLVRPDRTVAGPRSTTAAGTMPPGAFVDQAFDFTAWTEDGALGDPTQATVEDGERIVTVALERMCAFARSFADAPCP